MSEYSIKEFHVDAFGTDETIAEIKAHPILGIDDRMEDFFTSKCCLCIHFDRKSFSHFHRCNAFPDIPLDIWMEHVEHDKPYPNDNGLRFTRK